MKLSCDVIQDLLPLYHDGVCSKESKRIVEEHIATCAACKDVLHGLKEELAPDSVDAAEPLKSIERAWTKIAKKALVKGLLVAFLICGVLFGSFVLATQWKFIEISTHEMKVTEIYQLKDGRILYKLDVPEGVYCRDWKFIDADGGSYKIPTTALINTTQLQGFESYFENYQMIDPGENNAWRQAQGLEPVTRWYLGSPDVSALLIYEEGMALEPAPEHLEAIYGIG